ncbi:uncharacterized membrane protein HdeD (DUF308 family) [Nocardia transvalensis]|uniref:Uncharacterized membrane protein HdeD (DUF308 family) n=1 Tax=Nocardia transvalensis TaxID=37333 RepID=A0A7W9PHL9_9NOCA|nr:hypothetical protein [Nocardia transvalensis]MBB5916075.1 uncharacterized membrane protein HdeD (DUF308 family) [Nocardia transvalensis]
MTTAIASRPASISTALRTLYFVRFGFAIVWAALLAATASSIGPVSATLLLLYPVFDLAAAVIDHRASRATPSALLLSVNMGLSLLTAVGLAFAVGSGLRAVLIVWGAWAIAAGAVQLVVGVTRRALGGQWPMILSGGISVLAGAGFILQSGGSSASLGSLAGYATLGGVFFLISAIRLGRTAEGRRRSRA